jgi:hypothetical protein
MPGNPLPQELLTQQQSGGQEDDGVEEQGPEILRAP